MQFVHLHTHSHYSLLDGLAKIPELIGKAKEYGMPALALTDHGNMYGAIEFYKTAKEAGIKPIIGCELYVARRTLRDRDPKLDSKPFHLTVLARNIQGYKNLIQLVSVANLEGFYYKPRVDKDHLRKYSEGLVILSGCIASEFGRAAVNKGYDDALLVAREYMEIVGEENYFIEIQPHKIPEQQLLNQIASKVSKTLGRPLVTTNDIHFLNIDDEQAHEILLAVNTGKDLDNAERMTMTGASVYMMSDQEMLSALPEFGEAIEQSVGISEMSNLELKFGDVILPTFPLPSEESSSIDYLHKLVDAGVAKRYQGEQLVQAKQRASYELSVIEKTGFGDYFLIVSDFVSWAKNHGIAVGPGRGSAAGSIVSYALNITDLDPIKYNLMFERFLNPERIAMPDIDLDFEDERRSEVIDHITELYGADHVSQIITFGVMKARSSVRDVTRAMGLPYNLGDQIAKLIPATLNLRESLASVDDLKILKESNPDASQVLDMALKLEGVARHASTHAAGVIISKEPLTSYVPLQRSTGVNVDGITTQYSMYHVESIGLLKMDILGLSNLSIIKHAISVIKKAYAVEIDINNLPLDDLKTFKLLALGQTIGVFQLESSGMRRYIKELQPSRLEDIMAMVALYRPGPMEFIPDFIAGKLGKKKVKYLHPKLESILGDTYGIAVYQEQILEMARSIAGFSYGEADVLRKAIGKKIKTLLQEQRIKFVQGAVKNKVEKSMAEKLFDFAEPFARYGFNRAHAACYAYIAYQTAYLKAHFPAAFLAALLTSAKDNHDKIAVAIEESEKMGIKVLPPHINESFDNFGVVRSDDGDVIRYGLGAVKNVGAKAAGAIWDERKTNGTYLSLEDFLTRLSHQHINKKVLEALICSGAFDGFGERNSLLSSISDLVSFAQETSKDLGLQQDLFGGGDMKIQTKKINLANMSPASKKQQLAWEKELLGIYLSDHPLKNLKAQLDAFKNKIGELAISDAGKQIVIGGILSQCKKIITKSNQPMMFCTFEDLTGKTELIVFPGILQKFPDLWQPEKVIKVKGKVNTKDGAVKIIVDDASELSEVAELDLNNTTIDDNTKIIEVPMTISKNGLQDLKQTLLSYPGNTPIELKIGERKIKTNLLVNYSPALMQEIDMLLNDL